MHFHGSAPTGMRTVEREPRRASGAEEFAWGEVVEGGHDAGGDGS